VVELAASQAATSRPSLTTQIAQVATAHRPTDPWARPPQQLARPPPWARAAGRRGSPSPPRLLRPSHQTCRPATQRRVSATSASGDESGPMQSATACATVANAWNSPSVSGRRAPITAFSCWPCGAWVRRVAPGAAEGKEVRAARREGWGLAGRQGGKPRPAGRGWADEQAAAADAAERMRRHAPGALGPARLHAGPPLVGDQVWPQPAAGGGGAPTRGGGDARGVASRTRHPSGPSRRAARTRQRSSQPATGRWTGPERRGPEARATQRGGGAAAHSLQKRSGPASTSGRRWRASRWYALTSCASGDRMTGAWGDARRGGGATRGARAVGAV
jgi:hypothetical protein